MVFVHSGGARPSRSTGDKQGTPMGLTWDQRVHPTRPGGRGKGRHDTTCVSVSWPLSVCPRTTNIPMTGFRLGFGAGQLGRPRRALGWRHTVIAPVVPRQPHWSHPLARIMAAYPDLMPLSALHGTTVNLRTENVKRCAPRTPVCDACSLPGLAHTHTHTHTQPPHPVSHSRWSATFLFIPPPHPTLLPSLTQRSCFWQLRPFCSCIW